LNKEIIKYEEEKKRLYEELNRSAFTSNILKEYIFKYKKECIDLIKKKNLDNDLLVKELIQYKELSVSFCKYAELANEKFYSILYLCKIFEKELTKVNQEQGREYSKILIENKYIREVLYNNTQTQSQYLSYEKNDKFSLALKNNNERKNKNCSFHIKKHSEIYNSNSNTDSSYVNNNPDSKNININYINSTINKEKSEDDYIIPEDINEDNDKDNSERRSKNSKNIYNKSKMSNSKAKPKTIYLFKKTPRDT
jgi:hypothetical protein